MKLLSIEGENFGVLDERPLNFSGGLQVVYGPNEAGKSTLLRLIRETLFGFPARAHELSWKAGGVAAEARLQLRDGRTLRFRRQMRNRDIISGQWEHNRDPVDEATLNQLLAGASDQLFNNLFAFSLRELFAGEESLQRAGLGESLFTGGWGGLERFRRVQEALTREREDLFKPRGRKQVLLRLQGEIAERQKEYRDALVPSQEFDRAQTELQRRSANLLQLQDELQQLYRQERSLETLQKAAPHYRRKQSLELQRNQLKLPGELTGDRVTELKRVRERLLDVDNEIGELQLQSAGQQPDADQDLTSEQHHLLEHAAEIRSLEQRLSQMQELEAELPKITRKREELQARLARDLSQIGTGWTLDEVGDIRFGISQREQLQLLLNTQARLDTEEAAQAARRPDLEQQLSSARQQLERLATHRPIDSLDDLLERGDRWREQDRKRQQLESDISAQQKEAQRLQDQLERKLRSAGAECNSANPNWTTLAIPSTEALEDWRQRLEDVQTPVQQWTARVEQLAQEVGQLRQDLAEFDRLHPQLDRQHLLNLRGRRNTGWDLLRRRHIDGDVSAETELQEWLSTGEQENAADEFESLLAEADRLADLQYAQAELLARRDQLTIRIERQEQLLADEQDTLHNKQSACEAGLQAWQKLWAPLGIVPAAPGPMLEWRQFVDQYFAAVQQSQRLEDLHADLRQQMLPFEQELSKAYPEAPTPAAALKAARTEFDVAQRTVADRARLEPEVASLSERWARLEDEQMQTGIHRGQLHAGRRQLLQELRLPEGLSLDAAERTLESIIELQRGLEEKCQLAQREAEGHSRQEDFRAAVQKLLPETSEPPANTSATVLLADLATQLEATQLAELQRAQRKALASDAARKLADLQRAREQFEQRLQELRDAADLPTEADLTSIFKHYEEREQLDREITECEIHLQQLAADPGQLSDLDESDLLAKQQQVQQEKETKEQQRQEEAERIGALRQQLQSWADSSHVDRLANRLQHLRSEFAQGVDRWAPLALAEAMMQRALKRFEHDHQPRLLAAVGDWLTRLTGGRYRQLQASLEEPGVIRVVDEAGSRRTPNELSTGTREQLFLAIRLAYVTDYASKHDPLPLVLDDVLVNFDEDRALETLRALQVLGETHQILLLTCHRRTVELGRSLSLDDVVELQPGSLGPALPVDESASGGRRKRGRTAPEAKQPALFPPRTGPEDDFAS